jgi:hypothetical protein
MRPHNRPVSKLTELTTTVPLRHPRRLDPLHRTTLLRSLAWQV